MTTAMAAAVMKKSVNDSIQGATDSFQRRPPDAIDWKDFNYPPLLKLFHYSVDRL
jgi:hypothetical protein